MSRHEKDTIKKFYESGLHTTQINNLKEVVVIDKLEKN